MLQIFRGFKPVGRLDGMGKVTGRGGHQQRLCKLQDSSEASKTAEEE